MGKIELVAVDSLSPDVALLRKAAELLQAGGIVVMPTETRYGLLARADRPEPVETLYRLKQRSLSIPTALFLRAYSDVPSYGETNEVTDRLADAFLPGPLTIVIRATVDRAAPVVVAGKIGFRVSSAPYMQGLVQYVDFPITATSANISGDSSKSTAEELAEEFGERVDLYLDAGALTGPVSTVVDCSRGKAVVLRAGAISEEAVRRVVERAN